MRKTPSGMNWNLDWDHTMHKKNKQHAVEQIEIQYHYLNEHGMH
jgi:hypothetical protein